MKRKLLMFLTKLNICLLLALSMSGCWNARELNNLVIVVGIGIDKAEKPENVEVTAQIVKTGEINKSSQEGGGSGGGSKPYWNVSSAQKSIFDAVRDMTHKTGNRLFVSHGQVIVFGNDIASEGIGKYIDFFLRAHEMRPNTLILVSRSTASQVLDIKSETEKLPSVSIKRLVEAYGLTAHLLKVNLQDFSSRLISKTAAPIAPLIGISEDKDNKNVYVSGMAVFKNDKMVGILSQTETRGLLWVLDKVQSSVINIPSPDGQGMAIVEISGVKSKVKPQIRDGKVYMQIEIKTNASLAEQSTRENLATIPAFKMLQNNLNEAIKQEITATFEKSKEFDSDVFGFGEMIHKKYSKEWKGMEDKWEEIYPSIELIINVDAKLRKTDLITKPALPEEKKQ